MTLTATFVLASMMLPFENGQLEPYVQQLCQKARTLALPVDMPSSIALQSVGVCLFAYSGMIYAGQPTKSCDVIVAELGPDDPTAAMEVCKAAGDLTRNWAKGRF